MKPSLEPLRSLAGQLAALQAGARALGIFSGDLELVACFRCGLREDVSISEQLPKLLDELNEMLAA
jgi:hypothetical protein